MAFPSSLQFSALVASLLLGGCGLGEIASPTGPSAIDTDGDGVPNAVDPNPDVANPNEQSTEGRAQNLAFACQAEARAARPLARLTGIEYRNTLSDLLRMTTSEATARAVMKQVEPLLAAVPKDIVDPAEPFSSMDQALHDEHFEVLFEVGKEIGRQLTSSPQRLAELVPCAKSAPASCVDEFITRFGQRALRHALNDAEIDFYRDVYDSDDTGIDEAALADVITVMLNAPEFFYRIEYDRPTRTPGVHALDDYEIAARLSYRFWQTMPDEALFTAAAKGELRTDAGLAKQIDRMLADPRASTTLERFAREWLKLDEIEPLTKNATDKRFIRFAGEDMPSATLHEEMIQDTTTSLAYHALKQDDSIAEWLTSPYSFARSAQLASIYGTPPWNGTSAPPRFPQGQRAGLLTRAALLSTRKGTSNTSPILKGVLIRRRLLCDQLNPPPNDSGSTDARTSETQTTRQIVEALTQQPDSTCLNCHKELINPLGFVTEGFDALGRIRKEQPLYDVESGELLGRLPLDTKAQPHVLSPAPDDRTASTPQELTDMIVKSGKVEHCFARNWVRYTAGRAEDKIGHGCELEAVRGTLERGGSIKEALKQWALLPQLRERYAEP